jgi:hypothetical protein
MLLLHAVSAVDQQNGMLEARPGWRRAERQEKLYAPLTTFHARQVSFTFHPIAGSDNRSF